MIELSNGRKVQVKEYLTYNNSQYQLVSIGATHARLRKQSCGCSSTVSINQLKQLAK